MVVIRGEITSCALVLLLLLMLWFHLTRLAVEAATAYITHPWWRFQNSTTLLVSRLA